MSDLIADIIRYVNIILAAVILGLLWRKFVLYWPQYQRRTKDFWWVLCLWSLAVLLGTLEVLLDWGTQYRVIFTLGALGFTIKVMLRPNELQKPTFTNEL